MKSSGGSGDARPVGGLDGGEIGLGLWALWRALFESSMWIRRWSLACYRISRSSMLIQAERFTSENGFLGLSQVFFVVVSRRRTQHKRACCLPDSVVSFALGRALPISWPPASDWSFPRMDLDMFFRATARFRTNMPALNQICRVFCSR